MSGSLVLIGPRDGIVARPNVAPEQPLCLGHRSTRQDGSLYPPRNDEPRLDLNRPWRKLAEATGMEGLRIHDRATPMLRSLSQRASLSR